MEVFFSSCLICLVESLHFNEPLTPPASSSATTTSATTTFSAHQLQLSHRGPFHPSNSTQGINKSQSTCTWYCYSSSSAPLHWHHLVVTENDHQLINELTHLKLHWRLVVVVVVVFEVFECHSYYFNARPLPFQKQDEVLSSESGFPSTIQYRRRRRRRKRVNSRRATERSRQNGGTEASSRL